jgi:HEAT repeat protein
MISEIEADKRWKDTFGRARTPAEKKTAALSALTTGIDKPLQRRAVDYLVTLEDPDLIPVFVLGITVDPRIPEKLVKIGKPAVPELISSLQNRKNEDRITSAARVLAKIGDERAIKPLADLMMIPRDADGSVGQVRGAAGPMLQKFGSRAIPELTRVLNSNDALAAADAVLALAVIGGDEAITLLKSRLAAEKSKPNPAEPVVSEIENVLRWTAARTKRGGR